MVFLFDLLQEGVCPLFSVIESGSAEKVLALLDRADANIKCMVCFSQNGVY